MKRIILEGTVYTVQYEHYCRFRKIYYGMRYRTTNEKMKVSARYTKRGITTCESWLGSFKNFFLDMYESYCDHVMVYGVKNTSIDRADNNKGYSKDNCRWATQKEQVNNRTLDNKFYKNK